jgi:paraquat-inducible protein B
MEVPVLPDNIPEAIVTKKQRFSIVWLIPLVALLIGGWLTFKHLYDKGPVITIELGSAEGLAAGKTKIKYKEVEIGVVDEISFGPDLSSVIVTASLDKSMRPHLNEGTRFWVVRARVAAGEVQGLGTLLSGAYIGMEPGDGEGRERSFKALEKPPVLFAESDGTRFTLSSKVLKSFDAGAPVYYRGMKAGEVIEYRLNETGTEFTIDIFVKAPFDRFVHDTTAFWNASGLSVKLGADGLEMQSESMIAVLLGGLAFDNLVKADGAPSASGTHFVLHRNKLAAENVEHQSNEKKFRVYFDGSARGLKAGAPVTLRGITVGQVTDVRLIYDLTDMSFKIPVELEFEADRFAIIGHESGEAPPSAEDLVTHGLRAQLKSGSIITGQMLIDFDVYPDAAPAEIRYEGEYTVLPAIPTTIEELKNNLLAIMDKINKIPLEEIGVNLNGVLGGVNELVNSGDVSATLANINKATAQLNATLAQAESVAAGLGEESDAYQDLLRTMHELSGAARSLRLMAEYLERHPEALLKGKPR